MEDVDVERFAYDVCKQVLEKFKFFDIPDSTRIENNYSHDDFLPLISRSVVSLALWIRRGLKNSLESKFNTPNPSDEEIIIHFLKYLNLFNEIFTKYWVGNICISFAVCTEYFQFMNARGLAVSFDQMVSKWREFFEEHLQVIFEPRGGFSKLYICLENTQTDQLDKFQEKFISEYCIPYGAKKYTIKVAQEFIKKNGFNFPLEMAIYGLCVKNFFDHIKMKQIFNSAGDEDLFEKILLSVVKTCSGTIDSEEDSDSSCDARNHEMAETTVSNGKDHLGTSTHAEIIRPIAHFRRIKQLSPLKDPAISNLPKCKSNIVRTSSNPTKRKLETCDTSSSSSSSSQDESDARDTSSSSSSSSKDESDASDASSTSSNSPKRESDASNAPEALLSSPKHESDASDASSTSSKSPNHESDASDARWWPSSSSKEESDGSDTSNKLLNTPKRDPDANNAHESPSNSPKLELDASDTSSTLSGSSKNELDASDTCSTLSSYSKHVSDTSDTSSTLSRYSKHESDASDTSSTLLNSPKRESGASDAPGLPSSSSKHKSDASDSSSMSSDSPKRESDASRLSLNLHKSELDASGP